MEGFGSSFSEIKGEFTHVFADGDFVFTRCEYGYCFVIESLHLLDMDALDFISNLIYFNIYWVRNSA